MLNTPKSVSGYSTAQQQQQQQQRTGLVTLSATVAPTDRQTDGRKDGSS